MTNYTLLFLLTALLLGCTLEDNGINQQTDNDPEGTITFDMTSSMIDNAVYLNEGNLEGALFTSLGKIDGLGKINTIPKTGWANKIAAIEG